MFSGWLNCILPVEVDCSSVTSKYGSERDKHSGVFPRVLRRAKECYIVKRRQFPVFIIKIRMVHFSIMKGKGALGISLEKCILIQRQTFFFSFHMWFSYCSDWTQKFIKDYARASGISCSLSSKNLCKNADNDLTVRFTPSIIS